HEAGLGGAPHHVENDAAVLVAGGDVQERKIVGAGCVIRNGGRDRIAGVAQIDEVHALDDAAVLDVEAGDDTDLEHRALSATTANRRGRTAHAEPACFSNASAAMALRLPS